MKISAIVPRPFTLAILCLLGAMVMAAQAHATWYCQQGSTAVLEYESNVSSVYHKGWGLDVIQHAGATNWIHITIPTLGNANKQTESIRLRFYGGSGNINITHVHVYNGETLVKEFLGPWSKNGDYRNLNLTLDTLTNFNYGLSLSIKIEAGLTTKSHRFILSSACANFVTN